MIAALGSGVAMGNAQTKLKPLLIFVTDTNVNGGVAKAIWRVLEQENNASLSSFLEREFLYS